MYVYKMSMYIVHVYIHVHVHVYTLCLNALTVHVQCRYDSDTPLAEGDVGMAGVAVDSVEDMKVHVHVHVHVYTVLYVHMNNHTYSTLVVTLLIIGLTGRTNRMDLHNSNHTYNIVCTL